MKKIELPSDNSGGLRNIVAIPSKDFSGVSYAINYEYRINPADLTNAILIPVLPEDGGWQENKKESDAGDMYEVEVSGKIYGNTPKNSELIKILGSGTWIVLAEDAEGHWKLFGSTRVQLVFERKTETGNRRSGLKASSFSFSCVSDQPAVNAKNPLIE